MATVGLTIGTTGSFGCIPQFYVIPLIILSSGAAAAGFAGLNSMGNLVGFVSPYMSSYAKQATGNTNIGLMVIAVCLIIAGFCVLLVPEKRVNQ